MTFAVFKTLKFPFLYCNTLIFISGVLKYKLKDLKNIMLTPGYTLYESTLSIKVYICHISIALYLTVMDQ